MRLDLPQKVFARYLAVSQSTLSQIENGYYSPSYGSIARLAEKVPFDCNWLIRGVGEPFPADTPAPAYPPHPGIPGVADEALACYAEHSGSDAWAQALPRFTVPGYAREGDFRIFQVLGDGMAPTIVDQDHVVGERVAGPLDSYTGQPIVCVLADRVLVKRLRSYADHARRLAVASDNPNYETIEFGEDEVREVWHVTGRLTRDFSPALADHDHRLRQVESGYHELTRKVEGLLAAR